jgi:hypothetical protein
MTRYGDQAYDLRDIPAQAELVCGWAPIGAGGSF